MIDAIRRSFLWGGSDGKSFINWVAWDKVVCPKSLGGLDLKDLRLVNLSLLAKWYWRFHTEHDAMWRKVIFELYGGDGGFHLVRASKGSVWEGIIKGCKQIHDLGIDLYNGVRREVQNGRDTLFWMDKWCSSLSLKDEFPRLFALESNKMCRVSDRFEVDGVPRPPKWNWSTLPRGRAVSDLDRLVGILNNWSFGGNGSDRWVWNLCRSGFFTTKSLSDMLHASVYSSLPPSVLHSWINWVPAKVNICVWRARMDKLPSLLNLHHRGVDCGSITCSLCGCFPESLEHTLFSCVKVTGLWKKICSWYGIPSGSSFGWNHELVRSTTPSYLGGRDKLRLAIGYTAIWCIWSWRNKVCFASGDVKTKLLDADLFPDVQRFSLLWVKSRSRLFGCLWDNWIISPHSQA